jgi:uncharacterized LabA/DUF88 family protein
MEAESPASFLAHRPFLITVSKSCFPRRGFEVRHRVCIFIDGSNIYHNLDNIRPGYKLHYGKLIDHIIHRGDRVLVKAYYFGSDQPGPNFGQSSFFYELRNLGIETTIFPLVDRGGRQLEKGVDVGLAVKMLAMAKDGSFDYGVLVAGDKDYVQLVSEVQRAGRVVELVGIRGSVSSELKAQANNLVYYINDFASQVELIHPPRDGGIQPVERREEPVEAPAAAAQSE